jgi:glyoxylase-like metal-dependent hydrolase (beta-lactamase superfamily II)
MSESGYKIEPIESQPFGQVAYVLWRPGGTEAVVVDPGFDTGPIFDLLRREGLTVSAILDTHGHIDHIAGNAAIKAAYPGAPLIIGRNDAHLLADPDANLSGLFGVPMASVPADRQVDDGERFEAAGYTFLVREIPGHSPGSVVFVCDEFDPPFVFAGDVLFAGSVGRTDFPGGDTRLLLDGIRTKLFDLPDGTLILPGHGSPTTIGVERRSNPFVGENPGTYRLD